MLLKIDEMPNDVKLCKVLTVDKIMKPSTFIDGFPKPGEPIVNKPLMTKETAMAESVEKSLVSEALLNACWRMVRACIHDDGIGLAAPQIGIMKRLFIIREDEKHFKVYFHPKYSVDVNSKSVIGVEGCLSVPGKRLMVPRHSTIMAEWMEIGKDGQLIARTQLLEGYQARVFQHEHDHLSAISILNRYEEHLKDKRKTWI